MQPGKLIIKENIKSKTSNNEYEVYIFDNCIACTCPAGGKKQLCKHLISVIHKNLELIQKTAPEFSAQLLALIELKQNKLVSQEEKLKEYAKIMYSNKDIAASSHKNTQEIKDSDIRELQEVGQLIINSAWLGVNFYNFLHQAQKDNYSIFVSLKRPELEKLEALGYIQWHELTENDKQNLKLNNDYNYCAFSATEKLYTNKKISGVVRGLKNFTYDKPSGDIGIKFLKENCNITIQ